MTKHEAGHAARTARLVLVGSLANRSARSPTARHRFASEPANDGTMRFIRHSSFCLSIWEDINGNSNSVEKSESSSDTTLTAHAYCGGYDQFDEQGGGHESEDDQRNIRPCVDGMAGLWAISPLAKPVAKFGGSGNRPCAQFNADGDCRGLPSGDRRHRASHGTAGRSATRGAARQRIPGCTEPDATKPGKFG